MGEKDEQMCFLRFLEKPENRVFLILEKFLQWVIKTFCKPIWKNQTKIKLGIVAKKMMEKSSKNFQKKRGI